MDGDIESGLFADDNASDDDQERPPMLPALSPLRGGDEDLVAPTEEENEVPKGEELPKPRVRKPVPLLNDDRLTDKKRGLAYLVKEFPKIKFKGKGHEAADVRRLMRYYEHWGNRLFPKYPFDKFVSTLEGPLTSKARVKSCMSKLRRGEFEDDDEVHSGDEQRNDGDGGDHNVQPPVDQMADFGGEVRTADPPPPRETTPAAMTPVLQPVTRPSPAVTTDSVERIRLNRERAMARLAARRATQEANHGDNDSILANPSTGPPSHEQSEKDTDRHECISRIDGLLVDPSTEQSSREQEDMDSTDRNESISENDGILADQPTGHSILERGDMDNTDRNECVSGNNCLLADHSTGHSGHDLEDMDNADRNYSNENVAAVEQTVNATHDNLDDGNSVAEEMETEDTTSNPSLQ